MNDIKVLKEINSHKGVICPIWDLEIKVYWRLVLINQQSYDPGLELLPIGPEVGTGSSRCTRLLLITLNAYTNALTPWLPNLLDRVEKGGPGQCS